MALRNAALVALLCLMISEITGHGMMIEPAGRSSLWRYNPRAPRNDDDNQVYCGGATVQWKTYGGKCGVCGDPYGAPHPQDNENTGKYGRGIIARTYKSSSVITTTIRLTANHKGYFVFSLCTLNNPNAPESGENCFQPLQLANGQARYNVSSEEKLIDVPIRLPVGQKCDRCVLRWTYTAGNNWGQCEDGSYNVGCGPQETFRSCSDIAIV